MLNGNGGCDKPRRSCSSLIKHRVPHRISRGSMTTEPDLDKMEEGARAANKHRLRKIMLDTLT